LSLLNQYCKGLNRTFLYWDCEEVKGLNEETIKELYEILALELTPLMLIFNGPTTKVEVDKRIAYIKQVWCELDTYTGLLTPEPSLWHNHPLLVK
jgi:hypothetical protein